MASGTPEYWIERWVNEGTPKFHKTVIHPPLLAMEEKFLPVDKSLAILLPLCGRTLEINYFLNKGYPVIGKNFSGLYMTDVLIFDEF